MDSLCLSTNDSFADGDARQHSIGFDRNHTALDGRITKDARPTNTNNDGSSGSESSSADPNTLPGKIANALVLVYEGLKETDLSESHRRVLACLIRFGVNLNDPSRSIFIKKSSIALKIGVNEATVYRGLSALETAGIIERDDQGRKGRAVKAIATIRLTASALVRFGFFAAPRQSTGDPRAEAQRDGDPQAEARHHGDLAPVQDVNNAPKQSSLKKQPTREPFCKIDGKTVPSDLAWLHAQNGLSLSGIFKLMANAKKAGTKLSHVVTHCAQSLTGLSGRELFAYLSSVIAQPIDFERIAHAKREQALAREEARAESERLEAQLCRLSAVRGRSFADPYGRTWTVEDASFVVRADGNTGSVPFKLAREAVAAITDGQWPICTGASVLTRMDDGLTKARPSNSAWVAVRDRLKRQIRA
ncbi:hypothetical protein [Paraburkholderia diazotrophica]|uniref:helix-turn-helix transcriptional regulator n=1 Tax=Paraburkholderia diazotrophica TaxID=667676 RepID=UPI003178FA46